MPPGIEFEEVLLPEPSGGDVGQTPWSAPKPLLVGMSEGRAASSGIGPPRPGRRRCRGRSSGCIAATRDRDWQRGAAARSAVPAVRLRGRGRARRGAYELGSVMRRPSRSHASRPSRSCSTARRRSTSSTRSRRRLPAHGARLALFPETFIPAYPSSRWVRHLAGLGRRRRASMYAQPRARVDDHSRARRGPARRRSRARTVLWLAVGANELERGTIYNALLIYSPARASSRSTTAS